MAKFRRARPTHMDDRPATRRYAHRGVAVGLQHPPQGWPVAVVAFLFQRVGDKAQKLISQDREEDVRVDSALQLMIIGAQAQIAFERGKAILRAAEQDVKFPQLVRAQLRAVRAQDITPQQLLVFGGNRILALPSQPRLEVGGLLQLDLVKPLHPRRPRHQLAQGALRFVRVGQLAFLQPGVQLFQTGQESRLRPAPDGQFLLPPPLAFAQHQPRPGGQACLRLAEGEDQTEAGIEIIAQPPGKRLQNVLLLSGGEKALTALALLLAIFRYQPSPFCILDEVDAPLDDANIGRFTRMVEEMSRDTQFILITHSKKTMQIAPVLYGVTMEEPGVSRIVSVKFQGTQTVLTPQRQLAAVAV